MNRLLVGLVGALLVAQAWSVPAQPSSWTMSPADRKLVRAVADDSMIGIALGQLAAEKAVSETVKQFGQRIVSERSAIHESLKKIAGDKGVVLPVARDPRELARVEDLAQLSGAAFDRAYMMGVLRDQARNVKELQRRADRLRDPDVKAWMIRALPGLRDTLRQARDIASALGAARAEAISELGS